MPDWLVLLPTSPILLWFLKARNISFCFPWAGTPVFEQWGVLSTKTLLSLPRLIWVSCLTFLYRAGDLLLRACDCCRMVWRFVSWQRTFLVILSQWVTDPVSTRQSFPEYLMYGVLSIAYAQKKESTRPLRNRFPLSWLTTSSICKWLKIILYKPMFVPCQSLSRSQTHLCFNTEEDAWTCFIWTDVFLVRQDVNPSKMPQWRAEKHGLPGWENGCMIPSAKSCLWGWNYMLGNYTVAEITACCWQKEEILLFTPFTRHALWSWIYRLHWLWHAPDPVLNWFTLPQKQQEQFLAR